MKAFQQEVVSSCFKLISQLELFAREGIQGRWDASSIFFREIDPYCVEELKYAPSRLHVLKLVDLVGWCCKGKYPMARV